MTTTTMTAEMDALEQELQELGELVDSALARAIHCLLRQDVLLAQSIIREDQLIDNAEILVQEHCLNLLETVHPSGPDLRLAIAVLKINDSLERVGDLAENVATTVVEVGNWERFLQVDGIESLAKKAQRMLRDSMYAFATRDTRLAEEVIAFDDQVDNAHRRIKKSIELEFDRIPENASPLLSLVNVTRQFERVGDIACNIAEEVIYWVDGVIVRHRKI